MGKKDKKEDLEKKEKKEDLDKKEADKEEEIEEEKEKDMDEVKDTVKTAIDDMVAESVKNAIDEATQPLIEKLNAVSKVATDYKIEYEKLKKDMEVKDASEVIELKELLQKEPYGFEKDFVETLELAQLRDKKSTVEATKAFKDFAEEQESMKPVIGSSFPNKLPVTDFLSPVRENYWSHMYPKEGDS